MFIYSLGPNDDVLLSKACDSTTKYARVNTIWYT